MVLEYLLVIGYERLEQWTTLELYAETYYHQKTVIIKLAARASSAPGQFYLLDSLGTELYLTCCHISL
jgi:hypothetical protein